MLALGCMLFGLASAACALAPSPGWLIAARVVQGAAAAIVTPASLALIGATYPRSERSQAIGVWAAASALTTAGRSEEHTSELQSLMRNSYAVSCLKKKKNKMNQTTK